MAVTLTEAAAKHVQKFLTRRGNGTELDYTREGLQEGFKFHNPNEKSRCGCGESFHV